MDIESIVGIFALVVALLCVLSGAYVYYIYRQRNEEALFLTRLVHRDIRVSIASAVIALVIAYAYLNEPLPRPWGGVVIGLALIVLMVGPIDDAFLWRRERSTDARFLALSRRIDAVNVEAADAAKLIDEHQDEQDARIDDLEAPAEAQ